MALNSVKDLFATVVGAAPNEIGELRKAWQVAVDSGSQESLLAFIGRERGVAEDVFLQRPRLVAIRPTLLSRAFVAMTRAVVGAGAPGPTCLASQSPYVNSCRRNQRNKSGEGCSTLQRANVVWGT